MFLTIFTKKKLKLMFRRKLLRTAAESAEDMNRGHREDGGKEADQHAEAVARVFEGRHQTLQKDEIKS